MGSRNDSDIFGRISVSLTRLTLPICDDIFNINCQLVAYSELTKHHRANATTN